MSENKIKQKTLKNIKDCPIDTISLYNNSAIIRRKVKVKIVKGEQQVIVTGLPETIMNDSVRVSGSGDAILLDISYKCHTDKIFPSKKVLGEKLEFENELKELRKELEIFELSTRRINKEKEFLQAYSKSVVNVSRGDRGITKLLSGDTLKGISSFMEFFQKELTRIYSVEEKIRIEKEKKQKEIESTEKELRALKTGVKLEYRRETTVTLEGNSDQESEAVLTLSYRVGKCRWDPTYDVKVDLSNDKDSLEIIYNGIIVQNTGEEWEDVKILLSTANPSIGAEPPTLGTLHVSYAKARNTYHNKSKSGVSKPNISAQTQGATSTNFEIPRTSTIPSDGAPHKVGISILSFKSEFSHFVVPKVDTNTYLKVKAVNTSEYPLLYGEMNVFLDDNFIASGFMSSVSPKEDFESFLGVDPDVKVEYKPVKRFEESTGFLSTSKKSTVRRRIIVKNAKNKEIHLTIKDQLPKSYEEKIKVAIMKPAFKPSQELYELKNVKVTGGVVKKITLDKDSQAVEWLADIPKQKEISIPLYYTVAWPSSSNLSTSDI